MKIQTELFQDNTVHWCKFAMEGHYMAFCGARASTFDLMTNWPENSTCDDCRAEYAVTQIRKDLFSIIGEEVYR